MREPIMISVAPSAPVVSRDMLSRLDVTGPRYTSYPTADRFVEAYGPAQYRQALQQRAAGGGVIGGAATPLSVYVHIPFCESLCYYCACNKVITKHHERATEYLEALSTEIQLVTGELGVGQPLSQLHFGGGSPTFLTDDELEGLMTTLRKAFRFAFGITVRDFLLNAGLLLVILAMLTTLIMMTMDMFVTAQTQHAAEETARVKVMEGILNQCLSDATGRPVVIDNELYLCGVVPLGVKI